MICKILPRPWILLLWICIIGDLVAAQQWPVNLDESLDEKNDALIFRAVVDSMREWELHKASHRRAKREVSKVCYEDVGCFEDTGPFSYLEMLPSHPKDVGTRFLVYGSRKARSIPMEVPAGDINDKALRAIDLDLPTKVIVHGFGSGCDHIWVYEMRSALMTVHECNIVCVDWGPGSAVPNYVRAAANTRLVGRQLAKLIRSLNVPLHKVHLIGFSLGAHVAGFAGAELGNVSRITGLDPAGPLFESQDPRARLDATDANFVDVIHSNGEQLLLGGLGSWQPMGDVDFYPNGGRMQTGCSNLFLGAVSDIIWSSAVEGRSLCNHRRAYKLFTDSVSPKCRFPAFPCSHGYDGLVKGECFPCDANGIDRPCGDMGYYSNESPARGQLYLVTRDEEPFCAHQYQLKVYNSNSERPARNYGKLQMTLVGDSGFNETFAMTRKDEELLVGAILQKIVVPHPAITNVEAIEIKYTAYSGWISSGLVTWSIDKVAVLDSFGETLSTCKKSMILESGRPVYLPLYSGDCTVPSESDNSTSSSPALERLMQVDKPGGIGPFTKDQNYEAKERTYTFEVHPSDRSTSPKGLGPFTKEQNLRIVEGKENVESVSAYEPSENRRDTSNPWTIVDISSDGDSNSLENSESERGRGFSGSNFVQRAAQSTDSSAESTTLYLPEIKEPVLRLSKKETGRSLRLPEITEPILRPRAIRQNARIDVVAQEKNTDETREPFFLSSRAFTVQLLPERLAGFLAQAERYARETLIPLISEYTPSFGSLRHDEPKYFPRLSELVQAGGSSRETIESRELNSEVENADQETDGQSELGDMNRNDQAHSASDMSKSTEEQISGEGERIDKAIIVEAVYPENNQDDVEPVRLLSTKETSETSKNDGWLPISVESTSTLSSVQPTLRRDANVSRSLDWSRTSKELTSDNWSSQAKAMDSEVEIVTDTNEKSHNTSTLPESKEQVIDLTTVISQKEASNGTSEKSETNVTSKVEDDRKFIPLTTFENSSGFSVSDTTKNILETYSTTVGYTSHIQKIPRPVVAKVSTARSPTRRAMMFPYAYERKKDPRTRYIPLIPEEDMGRTHSPIEKDR